MASAPPGDRTRSASLTDSPWFWVELFSYAALLGLLAIGGKYQRREARLEQRYAARQEIIQRQTEGRAQIDSAAALETPLDEARRPLLMSLRPLFAVMIAALVVARGARFYLRVRARPSDSAALR